MRKKLLLMPLAVALCLLGTSMSAEAGTVTFDFNSLASGVGSGGIQTYMQSLLTGGATVSVTAGAAMTSKTYNGDGHVVGPGTGSTSTTLGTDTFIRNTSGIAGWSFTFGGGFLIDSVQFDYEIFPDGTCTQMTSAGCGGSAVGGIYPNQPDFTFSTNLGSVFHYYGLTPGSGASGPAGNPSASPYTHSPFSGSVATEKAPQLIGNTGLLNVGGVPGANRLTFMDWPATIGIDNLTINYRNPPGINAVPEPGTLFLLGSGLAFGVYTRRKARKA